MYLSLLYETINFFFYGFLLLYALNVYLFLYISSRLFEILRIKVPKYFFYSIILVIFTLTKGSQIRVLIYIINK